MIGYDWDGACRHAGITPTGSDQGTWNGFTVRAAVRGQVRGLQVLLRPPLDLGLQVVLRRGLTSPFRSGDERFDEVYAVFADEPERALPLVGPELRAVLLDLHAAGREGGLLDELTWVELARSGFAEQVAWALPIATRMAKLADDARALVSPPTPLAAQIPAWQALAKAHGLELVGTPPRLRGVVGECQLHVEARRVGERQHEIDVQVFPPSGVELGVELAPQGVLDGLTAMLFGGDVKVGDDAFDRAFVVRAQRPDDAIRILDAETRRHLLELRARARLVELTRGRLRVRAPVQPGETEGAPVLARAACAALARMAAATR